MTCTDYRAAVKRLDQAFNATRRPIDKRLRKCSQRAQAKFDKTVESDPSLLAPATEALEQDRRQCKKEYRSAIAPFEKIRQLSLELIRAESRQNLAWQEHLIISWQELNDDALVAQKSWREMKSPERPRIILVNSFADLKRELARDRCAIFLMLIAIVENGQLVLGNERRTVSKFVAEVRQSARFHVDEVVILSGRRAGAPPADASLKRLRTMLRCGAIRTTWTEVGPPTKVVARNRLWQKDPVVDCKILLNGTLLAQTDAKGKATLRVYAIPDGTYTLAFVPEFYSTAKRIGPSTVPPNPSSRRIWRRLEGTASIKDGRINTVVGKHLHLKGDDLIADLQPVWMESTAKYPWPRLPDMVVLHSPASPKAAPTFLKQVTDPAKNNNAHYFVDLEGEVVKLVHDVVDRCNHAGESRWNNQINNQLDKSLNSSSIGIEMDYLAAGKKAKVYSPDQIASVIKLVRDIVMKFGIPRERVVGHSDIGTDKAGVYGRRGVDPGPEFDWPRLRRARLGIPVREGPPPPSNLETFFQMFPGEIFVLNNSDQNQVYGKRNRPKPNAPASLVATIQTLLIRVGYSCCPPQSGTQHPTGKYDVQTRQAVKAFQVHFMLMKENDGVYGHVDRATARMLQRVG